MRKNGLNSGDGSVATKTELAEILDFKHFYEHFTFGETDWSMRGKTPQKVCPGGHSYRTRNSRHNNRRLIDNRTLNRSWTFIYCISAVSKRPFFAYRKNRGRRNADGV